MKPRVPLITLGVDNLECSVAFYQTGLGLATKGIAGADFENDAVAFFNSTTAERTERRSR